MKAKEYYEQAVTSLKSYCEEKTDFTMQVVEDMYPLEVHFIPATKQMTLFADQIVDEDGEIGYISVICGIETTVKITLKLTVDSKQLKKLITSAEEIGELRLHAIAEALQEEAHHQQLAYQEKIRKGAKK